ncbi:hypothetical protein Corgl_0464 [Coriobacterium glomerans PW2]|uniref:Uncharacterized protein n=1 Tax=Coriobacterium glomerans (strain ATCC 49209 / DSM 20642 / JCM 10262 / PW2) TaxID=700015 RepID=F2N7A7_CORGP|nr:hypothetical protein [Coriobacterium glomerans]AEB06582.1 hypothetical protein Corgl_0464 [Coriobacterium glomerans PW2]
MDRIRLLIWLRRRHLRTAVTFWSTALGVDLEERPDLIDRLYRAYLIIALGGWAIMSWSALRAAVEAAAVAAPSSLFQMLSITALGVPWIALFIATIAGLIRSPLKLIDADITFLVSSGFSMRSMAVLDVLETAGAVAIVGFVVMFMLGFGFEAAGYGISAGALASGLAIQTAAAVSIGRSFGYARLSIAGAPVVRTRISRVACSIGVIAIEIALAWGAWNLSGLGGAASASRLLGVVSGAPALDAALVVAAAAAAAAGSVSIDAVRVIEDSGLYAALFGVRRLVWLDSIAYHDIRRRLRIARRSHLLRVRFAAGAAAPLSRAVFAHIRQYESIIRLLLLGALEVPLGALLLARPVPAPLLVVWGLQLIYAVPLVRELGLAFRADMAVSIVRQALPFSDARLALIDAVPAVSFTCLCSVASLLMIAAVGHVGISLAQVLVAPLITVALSLAAAFDGVQITLRRMRMSCLVGTALLVICAGLLALFGIAPLLCGLAGLDIVLMALLARRSS